MKEKVKPLDIAMNTVGVIIGMLIVFIPPYLIMYLYADGCQWYDPATTFNIVLAWYLVIKRATQKAEPSA